jgi:hypothetical protein
MKIKINLWETPFSEVPFEKQLIVFLREVAVQNFDLISKQEKQNGEWAERYGISFSTEKMTMQRYIKDCEEANFYYPCLNFRVWWDKRIDNICKTNKILTEAVFREMVADCLKPKGKKKLFERPAEWGEVLKGHTGQVMPKICAKDLPKLNF